MDDEDIEMIKQICDDAIKRGHKFKEMGENPELMKMFNVKNPEDYAIGIITGTIIQRFHTFYANKHGYHMDQDDADFFVSMIRGFSKTILNSLFK